MPNLRIATFNLENLDDKPSEKPTLNERLAVLRPQLTRVNADVLCLQEVNGQEETGQPRRLLALQKLLEGTKYGDYNIVSTKTADGRNVYDVRNLVILSRFEIISHRQYRHDAELGAPIPLYRKVTASPAENEAREVSWERPILYAQISLPNGGILHVLNLHLKSRLPTNVTGQMLNGYTWKTAQGWAEGYFLSAMKRVGQAFETRILIDKLFDAEAEAMIVVCGDFNAEDGDVPLAAIRGEVENTGNARLINRVLVPCERSIPESSRYSLLHQGRGAMLDHVLASRSLLAHYRSAEIHNESLHDESLAFADDMKFPESDHAPVVAEFELPGG